MTKVQIEQAIDRMGLHNFLGVISDICLEKAEHVESNWQDRALARAWVRASFRMTRCADNTAIRQVS
jgi:Mn-dependent DtxR family transcriptional regulator